MKVVRCINCGVEHEARREGDRCPNCRRGHSAQYVAMWRVKTGRDRRTKICACGRCGLPVSDDTDYRPGHHPERVTEATTIPDDVIAPPSFRRDEAGRWYYAGPDGRLYYQLYLKTCQGCGRAFLSRQRKRLYCERACYVSNHEMPRGPESWNWRGGRVRAAKGYWRVYAPDHPAADFHGYVLEHRQVMERKLGRYLWPYENVHHINGIKDDNRPENLELWITSQPSGQRAAEVAAWARLMLARYGTPAERAQFATEDDEAQAA